MNKELSKMTDKELIAEAKRLQREIKKHDRQFKDRLENSNELQKLILTVERVKHG